MIFEELFAAFVIGISFSNAMVCVLLGFSTRAAEQRDSGLYFILGRFLGLIILGLIIATIGIMFEGYMLYLFILFGILTIIFGIFIIYKMYYRYRKHQKNSACTPGNHNQNENTQTGMGCGSHTRFKEIIGNKLSNDQQGSKLTKRYSFGLGVFRGATPCLKIFILAPLLIIVDLQLAFLMILVLASSSTVYPLIGFLSANLLSNFRKYDTYVQITGAIILISIGIFTIVNQLIINDCSLAI